MAGLVPTQLEFNHQCFFTLQVCNHTVCFGIALLSAVGNPKVNYLSLDIEGAELQVLRSIAWHLADIEVKDGRLHPLTYNPFHYQNITLAQSLLLYQNITPLSFNCPLIYSRLLPKSFTSLGMFFQELESRYFHLAILISLHQT